MRAFAEEEQAAQEAKKAAVAAGEGAPAYEGPAPKPVREAAPAKGAKKGAKHIEIIDFSHRRIRTPLIVVSMALAVGIGIGASILVNPYPQIARGDGTEAFLLYTSYQWQETGELCYAIEDAYDNYDFSDNPDQMFTVPAVHDGLPVYIINDHAFDYCTHIVDLDLRGVKYIGSKAFQGCTNIRNVAIANGTNVANDAFPSEAHLYYF